MSLLRFASRVVSAAVLGCAALCGPLLATEIVYRPVNPSFGGDPLNGPNLLNSANAQNNNKDPEAQSLQAGLGRQTPVQQFNETLQRAILSRIAAAVSGSLFDSSGQLIPGTVETADFRITIVDLGGGVLQITTVDKVTGQEASFQVSQ
jgi:curli production assembly/transport component CsgF